MLELLIALKWPLLIIQIILSPMLVLLILLQSGKDDLGAALGGGGGGGSSVLGTGGASKVLVKATVIFAIMFMVNSVVLAKIFKMQSDSSVATDIAEPLVPATGGAADILDVPAIEEAPAEPAAPEKK